MTLTLDNIRDCLEGGIPSTMVTCSADGVPNVTYISQVHYVDTQHVALSFQFFNKTHQNVRVNPRAEVEVVSPFTGAQYRIAMRYLRTEIAGPLFESMKARLAGIASHVGMSAVFKLRGADIYQVLEIKDMSRDTMPSPPQRINRLSAVRAMVASIPQITDLAQLFDDVLAQLETHLDIPHAMITMLDAPGERLYTVASRGYAQSGVGSEIALGCGVIGVAAQHRTPILIPHATAEYSYGRAIRDSAERAGMSATFETAIPLPGLPDTRSQLAVPLTAGRALLGVLYAESPIDLRFGYQDEDALVTIAGVLALAIRDLQVAAEIHGAQDSPPVAAPRVVPTPAGNGPEVVVRHYAEDNSIFIGDDYLIKGVAGAILAKLLRDFLGAQRTTFSNRELRLDASIKLPELSDNLEARLVLLQRRLAERAACVQIERTGRGRYALHATRPLRLVEVATQRPR